MKNKLPKLIKVDDKMFFEFADGNISKLFASAGSLDVKTGMYAIFNENNQIVEYMDILGNFSKELTEFAKIVYDYMFYHLFNWFVYKSESATFYQCAINEIPSKYFLDKNFVKMIKKEEKDRFDFLCRVGQLDSLIDRLTYKLYVSKCLSRKIKRSKAYENKIEIVDDIKIL